jgi:hypothetical protein
MGMLDFGREKSAPVVFFGLAVKVRSASETGHDRRQQRHVAQRQVPGRSRSGNTLDGQDAVEVMADNSEDGCRRYHRPQAGRDRGGSPLELRGCVACSSSSG